jgi:hypothetical protein
MVQLGFTCDYIMRAVLAVSALHLAYHRPDKRDWYTAQAILLHQRASRSAMKVMERAEGLDKDETACLFLFSMLTVFFGKSVFLCDRSRRFLCPRSLVSVWSAWPNTRILICLPIFARFMRDMPILL